MIETLQHPEVVPPVAPAAEFNQVLTDAEISAAAQSVVAGAEDFLQQQTEAPVVEAVAQQDPQEGLQFDVSMFRLFQLVKSEDARQMLASAMALDLVGRQNGIDALTFNHAKAANHQTAIMEADALRARGEDEDDE